MKKDHLFTKVGLFSALMLVSNFSLFAQEQQHSISSILEVQQYDRAIHIMAMLLIGFGFLMVFVRKYGRSALTATFLLVSVSLPIYFLISSLGIFESKGEIEELILAEFSAASLLIANTSVTFKQQFYHNPIVPE